jgi:hypothetical protein
MKRPGITQLLPTQLDGGKKLLPAWIHSSAYARGILPGQLKTPARGRNLRTSWEEDVTDPFCRESSEQPPGKGLAPRPHPEKTVGNSVRPREVLHGDHQLVRPDRVSAPRSD